MKKRRCLLICMAVMVCFSVIFLAGCGKDTEEPDEIKTEDPEKEEEEPSDSESDESDEFDQSAEILEEEEASTEEPSETRTVTLYYVDDQTAEVTGKSVEIQNERDIWNALIENGILTEDCELLSLSISEGEKKIDLDFNAATGDRIRSMGTTGETQIIGCIVNTYLEAYGCDGIRLTEEGQPLQTSHGANYDGYSGMVAF
ncbi:GerMN domain-containing protein [Clostridium sp. Marseille-P3244]|uniref:GerMN domain-containing protein n=1 Tax=Clostridium sp. Marseille-P3244 TaxID=1871020 RepID=UPI0009305073|nr:GerMN domain-containing protein [Clostridium sp. Marseille-P3244]